MAKKKKKKIGLQIVVWGTILALMVVAIFPFINIYIQSQKLESANTQTENPLGSGTGQIAD